MFRIFPTMTGRACLSGALACMVILNGLKKGSLTPTGGAAAGIVAMASLMSHVSFGSSIIAFYFLGSAVSSESVTSLCPCFRKPPHAFLILLHRSGERGERGCALDW